MEHLPSPCTIPSSPFFSPLLLPLPPTPSSHLSSGWPDRYAYILAVFLEKIFGQCSGYVCACGWRELVEQPLPKRVSPQLKWQTKAGDDYTIERATMSVAFGSNVLAAGMSRIFRIDQDGADIAFPIPFTTVDTITTKQFVPVFQSPGTTIVWKDPSSSTNVAEAIFSVSVLSILVAVFLIIFVFGIITWIAEARLVPTQTEYPKTIVAGTGYSIWYCTCMLVGVSFDNYHPRSKVSRVLIMVFAYVKVFALISLNAEMLLALQPETRPPLVENLPGKFILAVRNTPDEAMALSFGASVISVDTLDIALDQLQTNRSVHGIAVDTLLVNFLMYRAKRDRNLTLSTSGTLSNSVDYGYLLSQAFMQSEAVSSLFHNVTEASSGGGRRGGTTMGECMALATAAFPGDTITALKSYLPPVASLETDGGSSWSLPLQAAVVIAVYGFYAISALYRHVKEQEYKKRAGELGRKLIHATKSARSWVSDDYAASRESPEPANPVFDPSHRLQSADSMMPEVRA